MKLIGIFAGVGAGKSLVLSYLAKRGYDILEADKIAHTCYEKDMLGYIKIRELLGETIVDVNGDLDRQKMAQILYKDRELLNKVNQIIHPLVWNHIQRYAESKENESGLIFVEAAIIPKDISLYDRIWYIQSERSVREDRLSMYRGYSREKIQDIIANQSLEEEYKKIASDIIDNNGDIQTLEKNIDKALNKII